MAHINGITVVLWDKVQTGMDSLRQPIYEETPIMVDNVLVSPTTSSEVVESLNLYGKKVIYNIGIPKGDTHEWENRKVSFFGQDFQTIGFVTEGIESNIPLQWNKKIQAARYE